MFILRFFLLSSAICLAAAMALPVRSYYSDDLSSRDVLYPRAKIDHGGSAMQCFTELSKLEQYKTEAEQLHYFQSLDRATQHKIRDAIKAKAMCGQHTHFKPPPESA